jgi:hypothetical protein
VIEHDGSPLEQMLPGVLQRGAGRLERQVWP